MAGNVGSATLIFLFNSAYDMLPYLKMMLCTLKIREKKIINKAFDRKTVRLCKRIYPSLTDLDTQSSKDNILVRFRKKEIFLPNVGHLS